jgi:hypothetical protein
MLELLCNSLFGLWLFLPPTMWLLRLVANRRIQMLVLYLCTVVIGYFLFVGCAWAADTMLEQKMNSFDLDGDGAIGGDELTPEAQQAMDDWASDTGRTLAIFTGLPLTAIWAALCLIPLGVAEWIVRRLVSSRKPEVTSGNTADHPLEDGNPYSTPGG